MEENAQKPPEDPRIMLFTAAFEIGYTIAIPLILLTLGGRILDKNFETSPIFLLIGIVLALIISSFAVYRKIKKIM